MRRLADVARGALASLVLLALAFGVPALLLTTVGNPWPGRTSLELRDETRILTGLLAALIWVVWARFMTVVGIETGRQVRWVREVRAANRAPSGSWRPIRVEALPAASGGLGMAVQRLIATALLLIPLMTKSPRSGEAAPPLPVSAPAVPSADPTDVDIRDAFERVSAPERNGDDVEITVSPTDTLRSLASEHLGDAARWREIFDLNSDRIQVDGRRLATPSAMRVGWQLRLPADARLARVDDSEMQNRSVMAAARVPAASPAETTYRVEPGDSFWVIAERQVSAHLGRGPTDAEIQGYWRRLVDVNRATLMSSDPNLIYPGEQFVLPEWQTNGSSADDADTSRLDPSTPAPDDPAGPTVPASQHPQNAENADNPRNAGNSENAGNTGNAGNSENAGNAGNAGNSDGRPDRRRTNGEDPRSGDHARSNNAKPDDQAAGDVPATESVPLPRGKSTTPSSSSSSTIDTATGGAGDHGDMPIESTRPDSPLPVGIGVAALSAGVLTMLEMLRRQRLRAARVRSRLPTPPPAVVDTERRLRSVDRVEGAERSARLDLAVRSAAASMLSGDRRLCALIHDPDGAIVIVADGPVSLDEPWRSVSASRDRWSLPAWVSLEVLAPAARRIGSPCPALVPIGVTAAGADVYVDPECRSALYVDAAATVADTVVSGIAAALASSVLAEAVRLISVGVEPSAFLGSANHQSVDSPADAIELAEDLLGGVLATGSTFQLRARRSGGEEWPPVVVLIGASYAGELSFEPRSARALIVAGSPPDRERWLTLIAGEDSWHLEPFGIALTPLGLKPEELLAINEALDFERHVDGGEPLAGERAADSEHGQRSVPVLADDSIRAAGADAAGFSANGHVAATDITDRVDVISNGEASSTRDTESIEAVSEAEGAVHVVAAPEWDLMIRMFGLVDVVDAEGVAVEFGKSKSLELLAWIATHRDGATRLGARSALWDVDVRDATFANIVSEARRATARRCPPPEGEDWIARTLNSNLLLHERIVTDADIIGSLLDRAREQAPADSVESLRSAVEMIRGAPFADSGYLWPDAEGLTSRQVVLAMSCCSELADLLLDRNDIEGVFWATGQGLKVLPGHEDLIAYRMQAHGRAGDRAGVRHEWEAYERVLLGDPWSDGEAAPRLVRLRQELLSASALTEPSAP